MGLLDGISAMAGSNNNLADAISGSEGNTNKEALQQFEPCEIKGCKYLNEEGFCSKETCVVLNEHPQTAMMVTKICMFCGSKFTTNLDSMQLQICPQCLAEALLATRRVGDEKLKSKMQIMSQESGSNLSGMLGNFDMSSFANILGQGALAALSGQGEGVAMSNIAKNLETMSGMDMSEDLGANLTKDAAKEALGNDGGHPCMFCGEMINQNPSLFFPCCDECFEKLTLLTAECDKEILEALIECDPDHLELAGTESHCYDCDD